MSENDKKIEVMAPVGSHESFAAAVRAGADSIYFGVGKFNMRAGSSYNFSLKDIGLLAKKARKCKIKSYLTLNTIIYNKELKDAYQICDIARDVGINAVIASDPAVIGYANSIGLEVHISVQANISNIESVKFFSKYADVMVLARELPLRDIKDIIKKINSVPICGPQGKPVRIELFAHGALCVAIAGRCYMSLSVYNSSSNRGRCFQNCRRAYKVSDIQTGEEFLIDNKYVMSPADLCIIPVIEPILDAGISILKIEGRGRSPDYVYSVTKVYREATDAYFEHSITDDKISEWTARLKTVFNRGFWYGGYYLGEKMLQWCNAEGNIAPVTKRYIGNVNKYFSKIKVAEIQLCAGDIKIDDTVLITGKTTGALKFKLTSLHLDAAPVFQAPKGSVISISTPAKVRPNDKIYIIEKRKFGDKNEKNSF